MSLKKTKNNAFSIIELAVVLLIISIISSTGIAILASKTDAEKAKLTKQKMAVIYESIKTYARIHKTLPCPAVAKGKGETDSDFDISNCDISNLRETHDNNGNTIDTVNIPATILQGAIPVTTLGLGLDMIKDGWGYKFSYVMINGHQNSFDYSLVGSSKLNVTEDSFEYTEGEEGAIELIFGRSDPNGDNPINPAFLIISHGKNSHGAYSYNGYEENNTKKVDNVNSSGGVSLSAEEMNYSYNGNEDSAPMHITRKFYYNNNGLDDIVFYKRKEDFIMEIGWEDKLCTKTACVAYENDDANYETNENLSEDNCTEENNIIEANIISNVGATIDINKKDEDVCSSLKYSTKCDKYGIWSSHAKKEACGNIGAYIIAMWSGSSSSLPEGWEICDGIDGDTNNKKAEEPDLRNRFIVGAGRDDDPNDTTKYKAIDDGVETLINHECTNNDDKCYKVSEEGGSDKHSLTKLQTPLKNHDHLSYHKHNYYNEDGWSYLMSHANDTENNHTLSNHSTDGGGGNDGSNSPPNYDDGFYTGETFDDSSDAHENRPPYYALYYICKEM